MGSSDKAFLFIVGVLLFLLAACVVLIFNSCF